MTRGASSAGGLKVKVLAQTMRDVGLSPAWCYPFLVIFSFTLKRKFNFLHLNSVFDIPTVGNLPGKVYLELKENATPCSRETLLDYDV